MKKIISGGTGEFTDKKSRFIANIYHIEDEDMAGEIIKKNSLERNIGMHDITVMHMF